MNGVLRVFKILEKIRYTYKFDFRNLRPVLNKVLLKMSPTFLLLFGVLLCVNVSTCLYAAVKNGEYFCDNYVFRGIFFDSSVLCTKVNIQTQELMRSRRDLNYLLRRRRLVNPERVEYIVKYLGDEQSSKNQQRSVLKYEIDGGYGIVSSSLPREEDTQREVRPLRCIGAVTTMVMCY